MRLCGKSLTVDTMLATVLKVTLILAVPLAWGLGMDFAVHLATGRRRRGHGQ